jgi:hypothetical protein
MTTFRMFSAATLAVGLLYACEDPPDDVVPEAEGSAEETEETTTQVDPPADDTEAGPVIDEATFELRATAAESYTNGELGQFAISITPKGEFHMNDEFPTTITVRSVDGVTFPKSELEKDDAAQWARESARFDVPFTATAGQHRVVCDVSFAVCTDENCIPEERTLAVLLPVQ